MATDETPRDERRRTAVRQWTGAERRRRFGTGPAGQLLEGGEEVADPVGSLSADGAPSSRDRTRHSTGTTSGAIGHDGFDFEGEGSWGERERARARGDAPGETNPAGSRKPELELPDDQGDGAEDRHTDLDGPTEPAKQGGDSR